MSKRELPPDVRATMKLFAEAQLERIEKMSPEELDESLRAEGLDPNEPFTIEELLAKLPREPDEVAPSPASLPPNDPAPPVPSPAAPSPVAPSPAAPVIPMRPKRGPALRMTPFAWVAVAAAAVLAAIQLPNGRDHGDVLARAAQLRDDAAEHCGQQRWMDCAQSLDEARNLDPAGESQERVVRMRQAIALSERPLKPPMPREPSMNERPMAPKPPFDPRFDEAKPPLPPRPPRR
jgi:hypothetical protein